MIRYSPPKKSIWGHGIRLRKSASIVARFNQFISLFQIVNVDARYFLAADDLGLSRHSAADVMGNKNNVCQRIDDEAKRFPYPLYEFDIYIDVQCRPLGFKQDEGPASSVSLILGNKPHMIPRISFGNTAIHDSAVRFLRSLNEIGLVVMDPRHLKSQ